MNNFRWLLLSGTLVVAVVVVAVVMGTKIGSLNNDLSIERTEKANLQAQITGLENDLAAAKTQLTQSQSSASSLESDLAAANTQIEQMTESAADAQATISSQAAQIKTMKYPRHFNSVTELTNWLQEDDTNIVYKGLSTPQISFILQIRAAREGYLLPVRLPIGGSLDYITNMAIIGDSAYSVRGTDDFVEKWITISPILPSYPITPESGE